MGMPTLASVEIAAPRETVFGWLVEPAKLTEWMGGSGAMPADPSTLAVGFTAQGTMVAPEGQRPTTLTVTEWEPPARFGCTLAYEGGDSISVYTLTETPTGTRLELRSDTDWAAPNSKAIDDALASQPDAMRAFAQNAIDNAMKTFLAGAYDTMARDAMQKSVEASLAKLKKLVEAG